MDKESIKLIKRDRLIGLFSFIIGSGALIQMIVLPIFIFIPYNHTHSNTYTPSVLSIIISAIIYLALISWLGNYLLKRTKNARQIYRYNVWILMSLLIIAIIVSNIISFYPDWISNKPFLICLWILSLIVMASAFTNANFFLDNKHKSSLQRIHPWSWFMLKWCGIVLVAGGLGLLVAKWLNLTSNTFGIILIFLVGAAAFGIIFTIFVSLAEIIYGAFNFND